MKCVWITLIIFVGLTAYAGSSLDDLFKKKEADLKQKQEEESQKKEGDEKRKGQDELRPRDIKEEIKKDPVPSSPTTDTKGTKKLEEGIQHAEKKVSQTAKRDPNVFRPGVSRLLSIEEVKSIRYGKYQDEDIWIWGEFSVAGEGSEKKKLPIFAIQSGEQTKMYLNMFGKNAGKIPDHYYIGWFFPWPTVTEDCAKDCKIIIEKSHPAKLQYKSQLPNNASLTGIGLNLTQKPIIQ